MAEASRGMGIFGRLLAAIGLVWVFWGFLGPGIGLEFGNSSVNPPIVPGILIFFIGRAITRRSRRGELSQRNSTRGETQVLPRPEPRVSVPAPTLEQSRREPPPVAEPATAHGLIMESPGSSEQDLSFLEETPMRKTSAEMVAEARARYGTDS